MNPTVDPPRFAAQADRPRSAGRDGHRYDVIIVGARVAGAATGMLLARQGWRVLVVERARRGTDTPSTHALMKSGVLLLERWGVLDDLLAADTPPVMSTTFHYGDESLVIPHRVTADVPSLLAPRRTVLDPALSDAAEAAGAEVRFSTSVDDVVRDPDGRVVGITGRSADGSPFVARGALVIGADGVRSVIARRVDAPVTASGQHAGAVVYAYFRSPSSSSSSPTGGADGYEWSYRAGSSAGLIPTNDGVLVWIGLPITRFDTRLRADVEGSFWDLLPVVGPELHERIVGFERTSRFHAYSGVPGFLRRCAGPGWALVGDASHLTDPLSAHGITDALRDASALAEAADAGLRDRAGMAPAMARYGQQRDRLSLPIMRAADRLTSYRWDTDEVRLVLLSLSEAMKTEYQSLRQQPLSKEDAA